MSSTAVRAIGAMVTPVVLITAAAVFSTGVLAVHTSVNNYMRAMTVERLSALTGPEGTLHSVALLPEATRERVGQIDQQLPILLHRYHLLRSALLSIYTGVAAFTASVITLAVAVPDRSAAFAYSSLALVLAGTIALLVGCLFAILSIQKTGDPIDYEVRRSLSLGS